MQRIQNYFTKFSVFYIAKLLKQSKIFIHTKREKIRTHNGVFTQLRTDGSKISILSLIIFS